MPTPDLTLASLSVSPGQVSPGVTPTRKSYVAYLPQSVESVVVTAVAADASAKLTVNGQPVASGEASAPFPLQVGRNPIAVEVTAADGSARNMHVLRVVRAYPTPSWTRVAETNAWSPRDSAGELVFRDRLWLFGGYTPGLVSDVWSSPDGVTWTQAGTIPDPSGINIPLTWAHGDRMWVASSEGRLFSSPDGSNWSLVTDSAPWKGRYAAGAVVFAGKMWVLGGNGQGKLYNDVWSSTDGVRWNLETAAAPWSRRQLFSMVVAHQDKIWVLGGGVTVYHPFRAYRDVWNSSNGRTWTNITDEAPWPARIWSNAAVYHGRLWVFGGFRAEPTWNNFNDVWYSADGVDWQPLVSESIWSARHEVSAYVHAGRLWVIGGNAWPLVNDTWSLQLDGLTFVTQPPLEEHAGARYAYRARADFNRSGRTVRYRLAEGPSWLTIDPETGLVTGTTERVEEVPVTIEACDDAGETARQSFTLHVVGIG